MTIDEARAVIHRFAHHLFEDDGVEPDGGAMDEAARALVRLGPSDELLDILYDILYDLDQDEIVALTTWYMQAAAERGFGLEEPSKEERALAAEFKHGVDYGFSRRARMPVDDEIRRRAFGKGGE